MKRYLTILAAALSLAGCAGGYARAEYVYAEPQEYVYVVPVEHVVVVTRDVLETRGWTVYRVQH
jgi:PBP1b-binding outer membrane lipoprotein LpoB